MVRFPWRHAPTCRACPMCGVHECFHIAQLPRLDRCWVDVRGDPTCTAEQLLADAGGSDVAAVTPLDRDRELDQVE